MNEWIWPKSHTEKTIDDHVGFVYEIIDSETGKAYIGMKQFKFRRGSRLIESDWRKYHGSCEELAVDIHHKGTERFERRIISLHKTKADLQFEEVAEQIKREVLTAKLPDGSRAFFNKVVAGRWFARHFEAREAKGLR